MRLPNGYGTVFKLSGKRRRPYVAKKFIGWNTDRDSMKTNPVYGVIGYYTTRAEALQALAIYNNAPTDLTKVDKTFSEVYDEWKEIKFESISKSMQSDYRTSYKYCGILHNRTFKELKAYDYEMMFRTTDIPRTFVHRIRVLLSQLYQYAMRHDIVTRNVAELIDVKEDNTVRKERKLFTREEVDELFKHQGDEAVDMALIQLYTGMRPTEVVILKTEDIDIEHRIMIGGIKTKAGIRRRIPIHADILSLVTERVRKGQISMFTTSFGKPMTYKTYNLWFKDLCPGHTAYDCRHTFASNWHTSGPGRTPLDALIEKLIIGHAVTDITKGVYTHISNDRLVEEMDKYHIC